MALLPRDSLSRPLPSSHSPGTSGSPPNRAYRLDLEFDSEPVWSTNILRRRYSMPGVYTRWAAPPSPVPVPATHFPSQQDIPTTPGPAHTITTPAPAPPKRPVVEDVEDQEPFTHLTCKHTYPLALRGREIATLTILSRANRTESRPLLCDGDYVEGWITLPGEGLSRIRRIELLVRL